MDLPELTNYHIVSAIVVLAIASILAALKWSNDAVNKNPCFMCNLGSCEECVILPVESAYIVREFNGKVSTSCTLTFDADFVIAQAPAGGDGKWDIPSFVGCYKTAIPKWADEACLPEKRHYTFS